MQKEKYINLSIVFDILNILTIILIFICIRQHIVLTLGGRVFTAMLVCFFTYCGCLLKSKTIAEKRNLIRKSLLCIWFVTYLCLLFSLLLFYNFFGREIQFFFSASSDYQKVYIEHCVNLIPGRTFIHYLEFGTNISYVFINLLGNLVMMAPMAIILPNLFKSLKSMKVYSVTVIGISIFVELLQFTFMCGSVDIDDIILNSLGSILFFILVYRTNLKKIIDKLLWIDI